MSVDIPDTPDVTPDRPGFGIGKLIALVLFGLLFIAASIFVYVAFNTPSGWVKVQGKIVSVETTKGSNDGTMYAPVVGYSIGSKDYTVVSSTTSSGRSTEGEIKTVLYNPANPNDAIVDEPLFFWLFIIVFASAGIGMITFSIVAFIRSSKIRLGTVDRLDHVG